MKYNINWLIEKYQKKEKIKYVFFWGHQPSKDGSITASCFSQWWHAPFKDNNATYFTAEHWMMAEKARLFNDEITRSKILQTASPAAVKKSGRGIQHFDAAVWDAHKYNIVVQGNLHKFSQNNELKSFLLNTGERVLVEASPVDTIWGIGLAADYDAVHNPLLWKGENLLGFALMEVRDQLRLQ